MSNITVNISELNEMLELIPAEQNIMLMGNHGLGKSEILTSFFAGKGMKVIPLFLGQMSDPGDLIGIPNKNEETGRTDFMPPYWFPKDGEPVVLFLDELNRARPEVLQTVMDLTLNKTLAGRRLPDGSRIISAVNAGEKYQLTDLDPALVSRFNIYTFRPTVEEWLLWAKKKGLDERIISFIQEEQGWLDKDPTMSEDEDTGLDKTPDRRAWARVSDLIRGHKEISGTLAKAIAGAIGPKAASTFISKTKEKRLVSAKDILMRWNENKTTVMAYDPKDLASVSDSIFRVLEVEKVPEDKKARASENLDAYFTALTKEKKEAAAYFANLYTSRQYPNASAFIASNAKVLAMSILIYIKSIK